MIPSVHRKITQNALEKKFSPGVLNIIKKANTDSDLPKRDAFFSKPLHCVNCSIEETKVYIDELEKNVVNELIAASLSNYRDKKNNHFKIAAAYLGKLNHAVQDFYSHSNWIELIAPKKKIWKGKTINPYSNKNEQILMCTSKYFSELACFLLDLAYKKITGKKHINDIINLPVDQLSHFKLNKDNKNSLADIDYEKKYHESGFDLACKLAEYSTLLKWKNIEKIVKREMGTGGQQILDEFKTWSP